MPIQQFLHTYLQCFHGSKQACHDIVGAHLLGYGFIGLLVLFFFAAFIVLKKYKTSHPFAFAFFISPTMTAFVLGGILYYHKIRPLDLILFVIVLVSLKKVFTLLRQSSMIEDDEEDDFDDEDYQ